ncbi:hypothetical protein [Beggiatoa leptomitoformis]|uniref:Transporter n=1 Tax=Beggiatoa leptomitoformis TaxID=288004 RepID=A0A650GDP6_9GAMM|nr:hypothetical protein [Beggiatoa leptomitoformis]ALG66945.2 hypothetical protein AL038_03460 [Beggiatoa leptomitoformis]QGX04041.1 hypothetical protein BLE401_18450 [Beggiatoa leptomitoformis]
MSLILRFYGLLCVLLGLWSSSPVFACSTCMAGDPTLSLMGTEKAYTGRLRLSADYLYRQERIGIAGFNQTELTEQRLTLGVSYAWNEILNLAIRLPLVDKQLQYANLATQESHALGDIEISAKLTLNTDDANAHRTLWGLIAGLRLPTAPEQTDNAGHSLDIDVQTGTGAVVPQLGVWYGYYAFPYFFYGSAVVHHAFKGFNEFSAGQALVLTFAGQYALNHSLALQMGIDARWSEKNQFADVSDADSGGFIAFFSPKLIYTVTSDMILNAGVQIPVIKQLNGEQEEESILQVGVVYDF